MIEKTKPMSVKPTELRPFLLRPLGMIDELMTDVENLWRRPFLANRFRRLETENWLPTVDVYRTNGELVVKADLPGMKKEDVHITFEEGALVLAGERKEETEVEKENYFRAECTYGSFYRRLPLGFTVDPAKIAAKFTDGVLEVHVPMPVPELPKAQEIPIN